MPIPAHPGGPIGLLGLPLLSILLLTACGYDHRPPREHEGRSYGVTERPFRNRWWHYYERACSFAAGGFWDEAEADLRACLRWRQTDARRARTYGMHFVQCFAHRELGAVLLAQGETAAAEHHLRLSMAQEPSARAAHLLQSIADATASGTTALHAGRPALPVTEAVHLQLERLPATATAPARLRGLVEPSAAIPAVLEQLPADAGAIPAPGGFIMPLPLSGLLSLNLPGGDMQLALADPEPPPGSVPELGIPVPTEGSALAQEDCWLQYRARSAQALRELVIRTAAGRELHRRDLHGRQAAGGVRLQLPAGQHHLVIRCTDATGISTTIERRLTTDPRPTQDRRLRATALLLPPLAPRGTELPPTLRARYEEMLVADARFRYVATGENRRVIERELDLIEAGYVDRVTAARLGRRLQARYSIASTIRRQGADSECYLRLIHVPSGRTVATADIYAPGTGSEDELLPAVAGHLRQIFPLLAGPTRSHDTHPDLWIFERGSRSGIGMHRRFHFIASPGADANGQDGGSAIPHRITADRTLLLREEGSGGAWVVSE